MINDRILIFYNSMIADQQTLIQINTNFIQSFDNK